MRCLVTGASGFLGSSLVRHLLSRGHEVVVLLRPRGSATRLQDCLHKVQVVYGDLADTELLRQAIQQQPIDAVVHLAWFGVTAEFRNSPQQISQNLVSTLAIWEASRAAGCKIWVGLGSQAEYGPCIGILREDLFPKPVTAYGVAKLAAGLATAKMSDLAGIRHVWLRLLAVYGPGDDGRHMLPSVILDLLARRKPALAPGEQVWDYLHVDDAAEAICAVLEREVSGVFNLGSGTTATIRSIVEQIRDMIDPSLPIGFGEIPYRSDQVMHLEADITRLTSATGWRPAIGLERGLKQTIEWYRERIPVTDALDELRRCAKLIRAQAVRMVHRSRASHLGSCLSIADVLACLYWRVLRIDPTNPDWPERDRLILSKGHAAAILYATLAERGFFSTEELGSFCQHGSLLTGHVTRGVPGVELSSGSLGHGLPVGCGMALAAKREGLPFRTFVLLSDGELDEGSNWESFLFAPQHGLDNLIAIVDYNQIQSFGRTKDILDLEPLVDKLRAFRWEVREVDGHDYQQLADAFDALPFKATRPSIIIAHTIKGKGVSFMEDQLSWHYFSPNEQQLHLALAEIGADD